MRLGATEKRARLAGRPLNLSQATFPLHLADFLSDVSGAFWQLFALHFSSYFVTKGVKGSHFFRFPLFCGGFSAKKWPLCFAIEAFLVFGFRHRATPLDNHDGDEDEDDDHCDGNDDHCDGNDDGDDDDACRGRRPRNKSRLRPAFAIA